MDLKQKLNKRNLAFAGAAIALLVVMGFVMNSVAEQPSKTPEKTTASSSSPQMPVAAAPSTGGRPSAGEGEVEIIGVWQKCEKDADCEVVDSSCGNCCQYGAVNKGLVKIFTDRKEKECKGWKGGVCECYNVRSKPACINKRCTVKE